MSYKRQLSDDDCTIIGKELDEFLSRNKEIVDKLSSDGGLEDLIIICAELVARDREVQENKLVIQVLEACEEQLRNAAMNYYVSWK